MGNGVKAKTFLQGEKEKRGGYIHVFYVFTGFQRQYIYKFIKFIYLLNLYTLEIW